MTETSVAVSARVSDIEPDLPESSIIIQPGNFIGRLVEGAVMPEAWFNCFNCGYSGWKHFAQRYSTERVCGSFVPGPTPQNGYVFYYVNGRAYYRLEAVLPPAKVIDMTRVEALFCAGVGGVVGVISTYLTLRGH